ncbi:RHS repeat domain-containing protein [Microbulbifer sp. TYP-18]|uniref:RHS repeat domain-containing protein n=1 Tax=Microbulbifer sp. TYP-18 TaxID=3230024 RepID=UPI0034C6A656
MTTKNDNTGITTTTSFNQEYSTHKHGTIDQVVTIAGNGAELSFTSNQWNVIKQGSGANRRYRTQLKSTEVTKRDLNNSFLHREANNYSYDNFDNLTGLTTANYDSAGQLLRNTDTTNRYINNSGNRWILGMLEKTTVSSQATGKAAHTRKSAWTYDTNTGKGLREKILHLDTEAVLNETRYEDIDAFGNHRRTRVTGPDFATRQSTVVFDSTGRFVVSATNPLGHSVASSYYPDGHINAGMVKTTTDSNQVATHYSYDSFGRTTTVTSAHGSDSPVSNRTSFQWCDDMQGLCPTGAVYGITKSSDTGAASRVFIDQLGREVKRSTQTLDGRFAHVSNGYNALGYNHSVSEPHFDGEPEYPTSIEYDALGRVIRSTDADGQVDTVAYSGLTRTSRNDIHGLNQEKIEIRDGLGNLIEVRDNAGQRITYRYDSSGSMTSVTDAVGHVTRIDYDPLGRKDSMDDPDKGIWRYTYNGLGELLTQTNARGEVTCNAYDLLGRMVKRVDNYKGGLPAGLGLASNASAGCTNPGSGSQTATWIYDTAPGNGLGKLHRVIGHSDYQETHIYDHYSRVIETQRVVAGETYKVKTQYDTLHRPETVTYPGATNPLRVKTLYNTAGFPVEIKNAASNQTYYRVAQTDARGNVLEENLGNGLNTFRVYDAVTGRVEGIGTYRPLDAGSPSVQYLEFDFDAVGNLTQRNDYLQNFSENFTYDNLNRLRSSNSDFGNGDIRLTQVTYDALGNILSKTGVGNYSYGGTTCGRRAGPHAVTTISAPKASSYCYDANGNMTSGDGRTIQYSYFDKPTLISKGNKSTAIKYGPGRSRYQRIDQEGSNTTTTTYIGGLYEKVEKPGGAVEERHFIGGSVVVTVSDRSTSSPGTTHTRYLHKDHLGSITAITDEQMNLVEEFSFDAWGKRRAPSLAKLEQLLNKPWASMTSYEKDNLTLNSWDLASAITNKGFTGHEQLDGVGLIHMNGRVYDAEIGRFLSADPFVQDLSNLQALNRYSYVLNNPLSYTDPGGYFFKKLFKKLKKLVKKVWQGVKKVVKGVVKSVKRQLQAVGKLINAIPGLSTVVGIAIAVVASPAAAGVYFKVMAGLNVAISLANGAPLGDVIMGFAVGMVTSGIGGALGASLSNSLGVAGHYLAGGLAGGVAAKALGGRFKDGFAGGLLGAAARHVMGGFKQEPAGQEGGQDQAGEADAQQSFEERFQDTTGMTVEDSIALYEAQTGETLTLDQIQRLFSDPQYANEQLLANKNLHTIYRRILNSNVPQTSAAAQAAGFRKLGFFKSLFHNPASNSKWVGPGGHLEGVYNRRSGTIDVSNRYGGTFNFYGPSNASAHKLADVDPYLKWGN